jgi:type II secretory pathway pseudopilin PulG
MFIYRLPIGQKIRILVALALLAILVAGLIISYFLQRVDQRAEADLLEQARSAQVLAQWREALFSSRQYATDWVFQPGNTDSRAALRQWQQTDYQSIKLEIVKIVGTWPDTLQVKQVRGLLLDNDTLVAWAYTRGLRKPGRHGSGHPVAQQPH